MPAVVEINETKEPYVFGRPTKYCPILCFLLVDYFSTPPYKEIKIQHYKAGDKTWEDIKRVPNDIPTLTSFCIKYSISWRAAHNWIEPENDNFHPDFLHAYQHARAIRQDFLNNGAWNNVCAPNTYKFLAVNLTDMRDKTQVDHTGQFKDIAALMQMASKARAKQVDSREVLSLPAFDTEKEKVK